MAVLREGGRSLVRTPQELWVLARAPEQCVVAFIALPSSPVLNVVTIGHIYFCILYSRTGFQYQMH